MKAYDYDDPGFCRKCGIPLTEYEQEVIEHNFCQRCEDKELPK